MRVLFVSQAPGVGGGERVALGALARVSDVEVVVAGLPPVCALAAELGFPVQRLELRRSHRIRHLPRVAFGGVRLRRLSQRLGAKVLYANGTRALPYALGARILAGPPLLFHHHGLLTTGPVDVLVRAVDRWADTVVAPSHASAEPFRRPEKVRLIPNGIDLEHFRPPPDRDAAKRALGLPPSALVVGTVSRPDPEKGMDAFCELAGRLASAPSETRVLLAGGPVFPHEAEPYARIVDRAASLAREMVMTGWLADPLPAYQAMDVFVHLGRAEGFGLTAVEAMACGVPVVAYRSGGLAETLEGAGLLVDPGDLAGVVKAVQRVGADPELRRTLADAGRQRCEERYGVEMMADSVGEVIRAMATA